jgi:16S rRNA (guanine527-N7)-methyltransferase
MDSMTRRTAFLTEVAEWDGTPSFEVVTARAEDFAREPGWEESFDLVVARSFGPPAVTAECAVRYLRRSGLLLVAEPPEAQQRWPEEGLELLGLRDLGEWSGPPRIRVLEKSAETPSVYPRRSGVPAKRPVF